MFKPSPEELEAAGDWINAQERKKPTESIAIVGRYTWAFTPTSVGTVVIITDELLEESINVTNYDVW